MKNEPKTDSEEKCPFCGSEVTIARAYGYLKAEELTAEQMTPEVVFWCPKQYLRLVDEKNILPEDGRDGVGERDG